MPPFELIGPDHQSWESTHVSTFMLMYTYSVVVVLFMLHHAGIKFALNLTLYVM